ncbi:MAG: hypothetical protein AAGF01_05440 [Cyanobacteria bacterium P01_G01_bin.38]
MTAITIYNSIKLKFRLGRTRGIFCNEAADSELLPKSRFILMDTAYEIYKTRQNFRTGFRFWAPQQWGYHFILPPRWMVLSRDLRFISQYRDQFRLLRTGKIVWGYLVQANTLLFEAGPKNHPAALVYSPDPTFHNNLPALASLAKDLFALKNQTLTHPETEELKIFADAITSEVRGLLNVEIPRHSTWGKQVYFTTLTVHRKHLPTGYLKLGWFPLLIAPDTSSAVMILPERYWSANLKTLWLED